MFSFFELNFNLKVEIIGKVGYFSQKNIDSMHANWQILLDVLKNISINSIKY